MQVEAALSYLNIHDEYRADIINVFDTDTHHPMSLLNFTKIVARRDGMVSNMIEMSTDNDKNIVVTPELIEWLEFANISQLTTLLESINATFLSLDHDSYARYLDDNKIKPNDDEDDIMIIDRWPRPSGPMIIFNARDLKKIMMQGPTGILFADYFIELERLVKVYIAYQDTCELTVQNQLIAGCCSIS